MKWKSYSELQTLNQVCVYFYHYPIKQSLWQWPVDRLMISWTRDNAAVRVHDWYALELGSSSGTT